MSSAYWLHNITKHYSYYRNGIMQFPLKLILLGFQSIVYDVIYRYYIMYFVNVPMLHYLTANIFMDLPEPYFITELSFAICHS